MIKAFVLVNTNMGSEADLHSELKKIQGIVRVHQVYGVYDIVVEIEAESVQKLKDIIFSQIRTLKHVRSTLTLTDDQQTIGQFTNEGRSINRRRLAS